MAPDFIGIGAQRAGTTWLGYNLQLHPRIWIPTVKEVHYFDQKINDPKNPAVRLYGNLFGKRTVDRRWRRQVRNRLRRQREKFSREDFLWDSKYYVGTPNDEWYASLFGRGEGTMSGEITPAYSTLGRGAVSHVHDLVPEAKILFMMRNPIERAWSQAVMRLDIAGNNNAEAVRYERLRRDFESEDSRARADYLRTLRNWGAFYPEERIFVGFLEDVHFFPTELLSSVYGFLGVDASFRRPGVGGKVNYRSAGRMPVGAAVYLAKLYLDDLKLLSERFGSYASFWLYCAEKLVREPPSEEYIAYPLWTSFLWREWMAIRKEAEAVNSTVRSGPLSDIRLMSMDL